MLRLDQPHDCVFQEQQAVREQILFVDASFQLNPGERIGLVGPNGSGKTTLFRKIMNEEEPDEGDVSMAADYNAVVTLARVE